MDKVPSANHVREFPHLLPVSVSSLCGHERKKTGLGEEDFEVEKVRFQRRRRRIEGGGRERKILLRFDGRMSEHNIRGLLAPQGEKEEGILWKNMKFSEVIGR